jgi:hypothetical protein
MCNCSDEKVGQVAQRPPEPVVETLPAGVGYDLGGQAGPSTENKPPSLQHSPYSLYTAPQTPP